MNTHGIEKFRATQGRVATWLLWSVLAAGALLRVVVWLQNRSLFIDEANLARNFCEKSYAKLFQPLAYEQFAPPFFSVIQKFVLQLFGQYELALRLFPLLCGLISVWLFYQIARRLIGNPWVLLAVVWIFCFSDYFLRYATEGKQYSSDMVVILLLIWLGLRASERALPAALLALLGAGAVWLSMPAVFVLFGLGLYGFHGAWANRDRAAGIGWAAVCGVWLLSFAGYYWFLLRPSLTTEPLVDYHRPWFFPLFPTSLEELRRAAGLLGTFPYFTAGFTLVAKVVGGAGILTGLVWLFRRQTGLGILVAGPVLACILASAFGHYSLIPRMLVWAFPLALLIQGLGWLVWWNWKRHKIWRGALLVVFALTAGLHTGWQYFFKPYQIEEIRPLLETVQGKFQAGDALYLSWETRPAFAWYRDCAAQRERFQFDGPVLCGKQELETLAGSEVKPRRIWLLFSHVVSAEAQAAMAEELEIAGRFAMRKQVLEMPGAFGYLFEGD